MSGRGMLATAMAGLMLLAGCQTPAVKPASAGTPPPVDTANDPCAEQLHDICGQLLMYYATHHELPPTLADLKAPGMPSPASLKCPVSGKPYVYVREGLTLVDRDNRLILYDAVPAHNGMRAGIVMEPPRAGRQLVVRTVRFPDSAVRWPLKVVE